jgi:hypothetical protein
LFGQVYQQFLKELSKWNASPEIALRCLMARKFEFPRALELFKSYHVRALPGKQVSRPFASLVHTPLAVSSYC